MLKGYSTRWILAQFRKTAYVVFVLLFFSNSRKQLTQTQELQAISVAREQRAQRHATQQEAPNVFPSDLNHNIQTICQLS